MDTTAGSDATGQPFAITPADRADARRRFPPVTATSTFAATGGTSVTTVEIVAEVDYAIPLVATFAAASPIPQSGQQMVAALQTVDTKVYIDFNRDLPLWWFAAAYKTGEIAANTATYVYTSDADVFSLALTPSITLTHDSAGWKMPVYDGTQYAVTIGFGLGTSLVFFAYAVPASPNATVLVNAGGYVLAQSSGTQTIGDPVTNSQTAWSMPLGDTYLLTFDSTGTGTLTTT
ncbi:hypothetical protein [Sphingomonas sp. TREG-RG-20F-R18-01]|uniref:hypothetical protein n=1 Tax=Sphingomonas sp. TREG-RG-20F-R18-01 TaxID=2914982 RepID=UPI001F5A6380|nr:hypothetical protein [Sphingomonas sp. TREG-RG-20F-R18-01]